MWRHTKLSADFDNRYEEDEKSSPNKVLMSREVRNEA